MNGEVTEGRGGGAHVVRRKEKRVRRGDGERGWEGGNEELLRSREGGEDLKKLQKA